MAAQQPNFVALSQHLVNASGEIALIPNVPPMAVQNQLNQVVQQLEQLGIQIAGMQQQFQQFQQQFQHFGQQLNAMQASQDLLPMRLQNATASLDAPVRYPANIEVPPQAPQTKQQLLSLR